MAKCQQRVPQALWARTMTDVVSAQKLQLWDLVSSLTRDDVEELGGSFRAKFKQSRPILAIGSGPIPGSAKRAVRRLVREQNPLVIRMSNYKKDAELPRIAPDVLAMTCVTHDRATLLRECEVKRKTYTYTCPGGPSGPP